MAYPHVLIIILTWNHWEVTRHCLDSLRRLTYPNYQVLVVDNGSSDDTVAQIREQYPEVMLLENGRNLGFAAGCNVGLRYALERETDYVFLLNNDTEIPPGLLDVLVPEAESLPRLGILSPELRYDHEPDRIWFRGSYRHPLTLEATDFGPLGPRRIRRQDSARAVDYLFGTAMLIPNQALQAVGLFDESFFMYYEDMDLSIRMQRAGYRLYSTTRTALTHQVAASTDEHSDFRYYHKARSSVIFFRKHAGWLRRLLVIIPYRTGSMISTVTRLASKGEWATVRAYLRGLGDGLRA